MGAGATVEVNDLDGKLSASSETELSAFVDSLDDDVRQKLRAAVASSMSEVESVPTIVPDSEIPPDWGWPKEPYEPEDLKGYVYQATEATQDEKWDESLAKRSLDAKKEDYIEEKAFVNLLLNKEHTGEAPKFNGIDPNAMKAGRWYRFLNHSGECYVFVHNYTRDITATRPPNFTDLTDEEKKRLKKLGVYIKELPREIERIYDKLKKIPMISCSPDTCEALKLFFKYDKNSTLLDCTDLRRVNSKALEDSRHAIVNAMKLGTTLAVYLSDNIPELQEKVCISKNRDTFPRQVFSHGAMDSDMVKEKIYRDEDKEGGQMVVRDGFRVCVILPYDTYMFEHSSMRKEELPGKVPEYQYMEQIKVYNDDDKKRVLEAMQKGEAI